MASNRGYWFYKTIKIKSENQMACKMKIIPTRIEDTRLLNNSKIIRRESEI